MNEYEQRLKVQRDNYSILKSVKEEGFAQGLAQGKSQLKAEGIKIGEHKKAVEMAQQMLADHEPLEKITRYTQLTIEEIEKL